MNEIPRTVPRMLDALPPLPPRDDRHEEGPVMPPPQKSSGEQIADKLIADADEAIILAMQRYQELKDQIAEGEQLLLDAQIDYRETLRNCMRIVEATMKAQEHIKQQIAEAHKLLSVRNGK